MPKWLWKSKLSKKYFNKRYFIKIIKCKKCEKTINYENISKHYDTCTPDKIQAEDVFKIEENTNTKNNSKFEKLTNEEFEKLKVQGNDVVHITGKKTNPILIFIK